MLQDGIYSLKDAKVTVWDGKRMNERPIQESIFYRSLLEDNREIYDEYRDLVHETYAPDTVIPFENFIEILTDIRENGWQYFPMVIKEGCRFASGPCPEILDGQHRASALLFLDENVKVDVQHERAHPVPKGIIKLAWGM